MNRGELWQMALDPAVNEPGRLRLVVILSSDAMAVLPLRVVVPLVEWRESFSSAPWMVRIPPVLNSGLNTAMAADALQVRSVSTARLQTCLGSLPGRVTDEVAAALNGITGI